MAYLVVLIVNDPEDCPAILDAWEEINVSGVTILDSTGLGHLRHSALRDDIPLMPSLRDLLHGREVHHRTLLSVVSDEAMVDRMIEVVNRVIGDLDQPHTGFLFVVPVLRALGLGRKTLD